MKIICKRFDISNKIMMNLFSLKILMYSLSKSEIFIVDMCNSAFSCKNVKNNNILQVSFQDNTFFFNALVNIKFIKKLLRNHYHIMNNTKANIENIKVLVMLERKMKISILENKNEEIYHVHQIITYFTALK
ncbi:hypothetical protein AK88_00607 [Plasmodium fragile]|uniref:Uncharacterized protein n=1 Tax=Plasmodium fragile TaxID=5857 RepID=A0A0D9QRH2_PLAFR|nr:uncharacterized protein AK88_00607 [Plasmodium fragile]KJP89649.1 hypothetical protein AK88_00607 [Plasmodium fragile]